MFSNSFPKVFFSTFNLSISFRSKLGSWFLIKSGSMKLIFPQFNSSFCLLYIDNKFVKLLGISPNSLNLFNLSWNNLSFFSCSILLIFNLSDSSLYLSLSSFSKFNLS